MNIDLSTLAPEVRAMIEAQQAQLAAQQVKLNNMAKAQQSRLTLKVSEKGAVSLYGMGKWPVTLYRSQWETLLAFVKTGAVEAFIENNAELLTTKG